jgi:hypothetical protein
MSPQTKIELETASKNSMNTSAKIRSLSGLFRSSAVLLGSTHQTASKDVARYVHSHLYCSLLTKTQALKGVHMNIFDVVEEGGRTGRVSNTFTSRREMVNYSRERGKMWPKRVNKFKANRLMAQLMQGFN